MFLVFAIIALAVHAEDAAEDVVQETVEEEVFDVHGLFVLTCKDICIFICPPSGIDSMVR